MAEVIGLGMTHFPPFMGPDEAFSRAFHRMLASPAMNPKMKDPANWPADLREEYGDDKGRAAAARHREKIVEGLRTVRAALDEFRPDVVLVWSDDQYENFRETVVPAYCVKAYGDLELTPWANAEQSVFAHTNVWGEGPDRVFRMTGAREIGKKLTTALLEQGFDVAYAYEPGFEDGLPHAWMNTLMYLDYDRTGFDYPVLPVAVNGYGRFVISHKGRYPDLTRSVEPDDLDPPAPQPWRTFDFGAACARFLRDSPWRVALVASSSWSHGFLARANHFLYPDIESDQRRYQALVEGRYDEWRSVPLAELEAYGAGEVLNWVCLAGAANELGLRVRWSSLVTSRIFNSNKCFAVLS